MINDEIYLLRINVYDKSNITNYQESDIIHLNNIARAETCNYGQLLYRKCVATFIKYFSNLVSYKEFQLGFNGGEY